MRTLERQIGAVCRASAVKVANGRREGNSECGEMVIDVGTVEEILGVRRQVWERLNRFDFKNG